MTALTRCIKQSRIPRVQRRTPMAVHYLSRRNVRRWAFDKWQIAWFESRTPQQYSRLVAHSFVSELRALEKGAGPQEMTEELLCDMRELQGLSDEDLGRKWDETFGTSASDG